MARADGVARVVGAADRDRPARGRQADAQSLDIEERGTLEDVIEQLVGEVHDEFDREAPAFKEEGPGTFVVDGLTSLLRELDRELEREPVRRGERERVDVAHTVGRYALWFTLAIVGLIVGSVFLGVAIQPFDSELAKRFGARGSR